MKVEKGTPIEGEKAFRLPAGQRQLFLDDCDIAQMENLTRTMHSPCKKGAVLRADYVNHPGQTIQTRSAPVWDPEKQVFKFWVLGAGDSYRQSPDGLHWTTGPPSNRRIDMAVRDPHDPDPARRYKAALLNEGFAVSPDGIHWRKLEVPPIPSSDEGNFSYDEQEGLFLHTIKRRGPYGRAVCLATSRDFQHWEDHGLIFHADEKDQELGHQNIRARLANPQWLPLRYNDPAVYNVDVYNMGVFRYEGYYLGMPAMYHATGPTPNYPNTDGFHLVQLVCSRDLKTWQRLGNRQPFIGPSPVGAGAYDLTQILGSSNAVVRGDELWFYYTGLKYRACWEYVGTYPNGKHVPFPGLEPDHGGICLAVLRRDGFISLDAGEQEGTLLTLPFTLPGEKLFVNMDALQGELRVELWGPDGQVQATAVPLTGDLLRGEVVWSQGNPAAWQGQPVRLRFRLRQARFYSYWWK